MSAETEVPKRWFPWTHHATSPRAEGGVLDLVLAAALALVAALLASMGPASAGPLRLALAATVVFFVPGYLLLEAALPRRSLEGGTSWAFRAAMAIGLSPALVALAALSTALVPGAFRAPVIVAVVSLLCVALAGVAVVRRGAAAADRAGTASGWTGSRSG